MIVAQPVKDLSRSWATSKFDPAVIEMPELLSKLTTDNTLEKRFPGGTLWVIWANSSKQLRQRTARYIFMDEVDEYPRDLAGQGPADQQLEARGMSYGDRARIYRACTPTVAGRSAIETGFLAGDQRHYHVHCPYCGGEQVLEIERLQPNGTFACAVNGCVIEEHHKTLMFLERGHGGTAFWHPHNPAAPSWHRSYQLWAAYAPQGLGLSWQSIADKREEAQRNPDLQAGFTNLVLGRTFEGERNEQDHEAVMALAEPGVHAGVVPRAGLVLTAGVDLAHDRFEIHVIATGRGQRRFIVEYAVIDGNPAMPEGYDALDQYLQGTWKSAGGVDMAITAVAIDGGNWTENAAQYVKRLVSQSGSARLVKTAAGYQRQCVYLVRGRAEKRSDRAVYRPAKTEVNAREKTVARSVGVWGVGTSVLKTMIYGWLSAALAEKTRAEQEADGENIEARMIRFPGGRGEAVDPLHPDPGALEEKYYRGLTVEYFDLDAQAWIRPKGSYNEPLDTLVYAIWASLSPAVKADVIREAQWLALEAHLLPEAPGLFDSVNDSRETQSSQKIALPINSNAAHVSRETSQRTKRSGIDTRDGWGL